jgi:hypothetical protein
MDKSWEELKKYLPDGWEAKAQELGALVRRREIKTADELLALNLLHVKDGGSFQSTSSLMKLTAGISLDKNAVYNRITSSWQWLRWMAEGVCGLQGITIPKPDYLCNKTVRMIDASDIALKGSKTSDYRLHYDFDLFGFQARSLKMTESSEGEKLTRYEIRPDDIVIADRVYGTITGIEHVKASHGSFILRLRSKAFKFYNHAGEQLRLLPLIRHLAEHESMDIDCFYKLPTGELRPVRIVVMKKDKQAIEQGSLRMKRNRVRKQLKQVSEETALINEYIVLATNLDFTNEQILELYRARWQVEQVFYRLKSLFDFGEIPNKNYNSVMAWFYGKLLLASLCEAIVRTECFSPEQEKLLFGFSSQKYME